MGAWGEAQIRSLLHSMREVEAIPARRGRRRQVETAALLGEGLPESARAILRAKFEDKEHLQVRWQLACELDDQQRPHGGLVQENERDDDPSRMLYEGREVFGMA